MRLGSLILAVLASLVAFAPPARASCPTGQTTLSSLQGEILACISNQTAANSISPGTVGSVLTDILNFSAATVSGLSPLATTSPGSGVVGALGAAVNGSSGMALLNGAPAAGDCLKWSSSGIQDAGVACAGSSGVVSSGTAGQLAYYASSGATVSGLPPGPGVVSALGASPNASSGLVLANGALTVGDCLKWSTSGIQDAGSACGTSGGSGTVSNSAAANQLAYYSSAGTTVGPLTTGTGVATALGYAANGANGPIVATAAGFLGVGQVPILAGDVTTPGGSLATTIAAGAVTYAKQAASAANTLAGNPTGSSATKQDVSVPGCTATALQWTSGTGFSCPTFFASSTVKGTTTNDSAASGYLGEVLSSDVATGSAVTLAATNTAYNVTSLSLTAGDWTCFGNTQINPGAGTVFTIVFSWMSTTSASAPAAYEAAGMNQFYTPATANIYPSVNPSPVRFSLGSTTTVYLEAQASYTIASPKAYGRLECRRTR